MNLKKRNKLDFFLSGFLFCFLVASVKTMAQNLNFEQLESRVFKLDSSQTSAHDGSYQPC